MSLILMFVSPRCAIEGVSRASVLTQFRISCTTSFHTLTPLPIVRLSFLVDMHLKTTRRTSATTRSSSKLVILMLSKH